ncbi:glycoside hydrolase family 68 protein [Altererythrobacter fulvus]|uniref:glycoside hydrolase family 68 protein n=1 Tax=Caenibius fulvus TaxID=2126012 RepID=UPI00301689A6
MIAPDVRHTAPLICAGDFTRISPDLDIWDAWPLQDRAGNPAAVGTGETLWMALAAPHQENPDERHGLARIHLFQKDAVGWTHLGPVFPDGFTPGSREWSGSAVLDAGCMEVTVYFTAAGWRGETAPSFTQRLFSARARLVGNNGAYRLEGWKGLEEFIRPDPNWYMDSDAGTGSVGTIKAFRDPAFFHDPASGAGYMFFAASLAGSSHDFNGVIGVASTRGGAGGGWTLLPPLISADGLNNELERPHMIMHGGNYYLFWSTQSQVFEPVGPVGPTGLYGMVSKRIDAGWQPLNGTGLVFANPAEAPGQAYSWLVLPDLSVISFVDNWGQSAGSATRRFGGSFAPVLKLRLDGQEAGLEL